MAISVSDLIGELNYSADGRGEEAKLELISGGVDVIPQLAARVVDLDRLGKLLAIDVIETLGDARACSSLIALLRDDDSTVVEWSARALGRLGCREAVGPLLPQPDLLVQPEWINEDDLRASR